MLVVTRSARQGIRVGKEFDVVVDQVSPSYVTLLFPDGKKLKLSPGTQLELALKSGVTFALVVTRCGEMRAGLGIIAPREVHVDRI